MDAWLKEVAPSSELRRWFGHDAEKWDEFQRRYRAELDANPGAWKMLLEAVKQGNVNLLYFACDTEHNNALYLNPILRNTWQPEESAELRTTNTYFGGCCFAAARLK